MSRRRRLTIAAGLLPLVSGIGCSLVYQYGDVPSAFLETDGSADATNDVTMAPDHEVGDGGTMQPEDASHDGGLTTTDANVDAGPLVPAGAVVISGVGKGADGGLSYVLSVLDPTTGKELSRENMAAVGISYDAATDTWYIFETLNPGIVLTAGPYPTSPGDPVVLHVRQLDTHSGVWTELKKFAVPTLAYNNTIAPLTNRLAYVAYAPADASTFEELVLLDTTTPANTVDTGLSTPLGFNPSAMVGTRTTLNGNEGGELALVQDTSGSSVAGDLQFVTAKINANSVTFGPTPTLLEPAPSAHAIVGGGSYLPGGPSNLFALPLLDGGGLLSQYDPSSGAKIAGTDIAFANATSQRFGMAIAQCPETVFVSQVTATSLLAIPLTSGGTPASFEVSHTVSSVNFEPFTNTAIASFNGGDGYEILAVSLGGTPAAPMLTSRSSIATKLPWAPPGDLRPTIVAVRQPLSCP
jgi:hypothetical protein